MNFADHILPEDRPFYGELSAWLDANLPPLREALRNVRPGTTEHRQLLRSWHRQCADAHWVGVSWPARHGGRDASASQQAIVDLELAGRRAPGFPGQMAVERVGPALILYGTESQRDRYLEPIRRGEWFWCQGFSEPDAGSDLAGLKTRAVRCEGGYRVSGQKIWTSGAQHADRMWLLARSSPDAPKHHGISAFILDMSVPGISVRPIAQISGDPGEGGFNEIFFDEVFIPEHDRIGPEDEGWQVARATLVRERAGNSSMFLRGATAVIEMLLTLPAEPLVQDLHGDDMRWFEDQVVEARTLAVGLQALLEQGILTVLSGESTGAETSVVKLLASELQQRVMELSLSAAGPYGELLLPSPEAFKKGNAALGFLRSRANTIGGGTSEIQRNWVAERILGLPKT